MSWSWARLRTDEAPQPATPGGVPEPGRVEELDGYHDVIAGPTIPSERDQDHCRRCGCPLPWPRPAGVTFADGSAECVACCEAEDACLLAAGERAVRGVVATSDAGELLVGEGEP